MPVILDPRDLNLWLNPDIAEIERLKYLFDPYPVEKMTLHPVSDMVNSPRNDTPECILPVER
jgi:putative SOS response-associated peptidase YedK